MDNSSVIYGNPMPKKVVKKAEKSKTKFIKKYGDDSNADYKINFKPISNKCLLCSYVVYVESILKIFIFN